jgi:multicomponent Na+:H+ antiporter subunit C
MADLVASHYTFWIIMVLQVIGLYGMLMKRNLVKKLIGINIFQTSIILLWVAIAYEHGGSVPVYDPTIGLADPADYMNPLPHTLMLTAIVVGVAITGVGLALLVAIYRRFGSLDEEEILERMR